MHKKTILLLIFVTSLSSNAFGMKKRHKRLCKVKQAEMQSELSALKRQVRKDKQKVKGLETSVFETKLECLRDFKQLENQRPDLSNDPYSDDESSLSDDAYSDKTYADIMKRATEAKRQLQQGDKIMKRLKNKQEQIEEIENYLRKGGNKTLGDLKQRMAQKRECRKQLPKTIRAWNERNKELDRIKKETFAIADTIQGVETCKQCAERGYDFQRCSRCKKAYYCSRECQTIDWPVHKTKCVAHKQSCELFNE